MSRLRRLASVMTVVVGTFSIASPGLAAGPRDPVPIEGLVVVPPPQVTAKTWILYDATYDLVLASEGADEPRAMASTTKIMTAMVALEAPDPGRLVTVSDNAADIGESEIGLVAGEQLPLDALIKALIIRSGNDAAIAIAESVAGSEAAFVDRMNQRARDMGLEHTHFANPHGLDAEGHYTSARDLLTMARAAMKNPVFAAAAWSRSYRFPDAPDGTTRQAWATNQLLSEYEGMIGVKTGFTFDAGLVLAAAAVRDGRTLYTVVMGSEGENAHFDDTRRLLDYGFEEYGVVPLIVEGREYGLGRAGGETYPLLAAASGEAFIHLAAAGLLSPQLGIVDGAPVLEVGDDTIEVGIEQDATPLPGLGQAFGWLWGSGS